jgi:alkylation response protein AidB-like acyl-CoA dehydrogenase
MDAPTFALTDTHREFRDTLRKFAEDRVAPHAAEADRDAAFPKQSYDACVELELPALGIPVEYGGAGADMVTQAIMAEDAGSDVASMRCRAVRDGDHYLLTGSKHWITNAGVSDTYTVFAVTDPSAGRGKGISCFVVEADWGVEVAPHEDKMGLRGSPTAAVSFDQVRVPAANLVGEEGMGFTIAMHTLDRSRPTIGAQAVGIAQGAIDFAAGYMKERKAFGKAIADQQGLRLLIDSGDPTGELTMIGAMAKCFASDTAMSVTTDAVQLLGGYGFTKDFPVERFMRDAKITQIYEGTNQIQRVVIAKKLLG